MSNREMTLLRVKRLNENARLPTKGTRGSAGYDLYNLAEVTIEPRSRANIKLGISFEIPEGSYGRVAPRSSLAVKKGIAVGAGVIDSDYRGEVSVVLFNHSDEPVTLSAEDRIAQLIIEKIVECDLEEVTELSDTGRGAGGFGSTGV